MRYRGSGRGAVDYHFGNTANIAANHGAGVRHRL